MDVKVPARTGHNLVDIYIYIILVNKWNEERGKEDGITGG